MEYDTSCGANFLRVVGEAILIQPDLVLHKFAEWKLTPDLENLVRKLLIH